MTVLGETPTTRDRLTIALMEWQFVRISSEQLRSVLNEYLDENADELQMNTLTDPKVSDEEFARIALELFAEKKGTGFKSLDPLPSIPEPVIVEEQPRRLKPLPEHTGEPTIDWVAMFYGLDDFIGGITRGWLSIPRIIGLLCISAVVALPFYLIDEVPVQWKQALPFGGGESKNLEDGAEQSIITNDRDDSASPVQTEGENTSSSQVPAIDQTSTDRNSQPVAEQQSSASGDISREQPRDPVEQTSSNENAEPQNSEQTVSSDNTPGINTSQIPPAVDLETLRPVIERIESEDFGEAYATLDKGLASGDIPDGNIAKLVRVEAMIREAKDGARDTAWQMLMELDDEEAPELCRLFITRWLMGSSVAERTQILLSNSGSGPLADRAVVWAEARGGSSDPDTVENLTRYIESSDFSVCDSIFLANTYFQAEKEDKAFDVLFEAKAELRDLKLESFVENWLLASIKESLLQTLETSLTRISNGLASPSPRVGTSI